MSELSRKLQQKGLVGVAESILPGGEGLLAEEAGLRQRLYQPISPSEVNQVLGSLKTEEDLLRLPDAYLRVLVDLGPQFLVNQLGMSEEEAQNLHWHLSDLEAGISGFNLEVDAI